MAEQTHRGPFVAGDNLGVHVVSEHVYCPRAGLITHAGTPSDEGVEPSILRLDYAPNYELAEIKRQLAIQASLHWQLLAIAVGFALAGFVMSLAVHWSLLYAGLLAAGIPARYFWLEMGKSAKLWREDDAAESAQALEPSAAIQQDEPVNWWSLRAAGFVSHPVENTQIDAELKLVGKPWRILRRGDMAIPAFVRRSDKPLTSQQRVRIAAYCQLIRVNEQAESPFGIVLNPGTFEGIAVKPSEGDFERLRRALRHAPRVLLDWTNLRSFPPAPHESNFAPCSNCPHGKPSRLVPGKSETTSYGRNVPPFRMKSGIVANVDFHSPCGDHFQWTPKHEDADELELRPA